MGAVKRVVLILGFLLLASPAWATITLVNTASSAWDTNGGITSETTGSFSASAGNLLAVSCGYQDTSTVTVSDVGGDGFTQAVQETSESANGNVQTGFYAMNIAAQASETVTCHYDGTGSYAQVLVHQYSGIATTSALDATAHGDSGNGKTATSSSFSTTQASEVAVAFVRCGSSGQTFTAGTGYTLRLTPSNGSEASEDQIFSSTQSGVTAKMTYSTSTNNSIIVMTFKAGGGGPPPCTPTLTLLGVGRCG